MNDVVTSYAEAAYALVVAGLAMIHPALALVGAAAYLVVLAVIADRREVPK